MASICRMDACHFVFGWNIYICNVQRFMMLLASKYTLVPIPCGQRSFGFVSSSSARPMAVEI